MDMSMTQAGYLSKFLTLLISVLVLTACATSSSTSVPMQGGSAAGGGEGDASPLYVIGPGDSLNVFVWVMMNSPRKLWYVRTV